MVRPIQLIVEVTIGELMPGLDSHTSFRIGHLNLCTNSPHFWMHLVDWFFFGAPHHPTTPAAPPRLKAKSRGVGASRSAVKL